VSSASVSDAVQDYLREIYKLQAEHAPVKTSTLARRMGVAPPSATAMVKKLAALGLADHQLYRGVRLTRRGERIALEVLRHHRLIELYLAKTLELELDAVHAEADRLEHVLSETLEERIDAALGSPTEDPHGAPIPDARLRMVRPAAEIG
jgi:DtxR family Mn-dependent transcriptional regulator